MLRRALALVVVLLLAAACGGTPVSQPAGSTKVVMSDFKFDPKDISVSSGKVVFYLVNNGPASHDLTIADQSGKVIKKSSLVQSGDAIVFTVDSLDAGKYAIWCDVVGHKDAGMTGNLTVT
jgi:uncharacterized cupredoxin-like copper-binding protein